MLNKIFDSKKTLEVIIYLRSNNQTPSLTSISKELSLTTCYLQKIVKYLSDLEFIESFRFGRVKHVELSKKGRLIANKLFELNELLNKKE